MDKISDEDKKVIEDAVEEAKKHQDSTDKDEIEAATKALNEAIMPIGAKMYEAASKDAEASTEAGESEDKSSKGKKQNKSKADEAVEGEVVEDDKKQ